MNVRFRLPQVIRLVLAIALSTLTMSAPPARAQTPPALQVAVTLNDGFEAYFAQDLGMFRRAGLNVTIRSFTAGPAIAAAISGHDLQIGISNVVTVAQAREHGLPFTLLAPASLTLSSAPATEIVVSPNSTVRGAKDLNNTTVGAASVAGILRLSAQAWIDRNGGDSRSVKFAEVTPSETVAALERGTIAAALMVEPALTAARKDVRVLGNPFDGIGSRLLVTGWFASSDWLEQNAQTAKTFAKVIAAAAKWANDPHNRAAVDAIVAKYTNGGAGGRIVYATALNPADLQPILDSAAKYNFLERPLAANDIIFQR